MPIAEIETPTGRIFEFPIQGPKPTPEEQAMMKRAIEAQEPSGAVAVDPEAEPPGKEEQAFLSRFIPRNVQDFRGAFVGGGATLGGVAALPSAALLGPAGPAAGAVLGAAGSSLGFDALVELGRKTGVVGPEGILADAPDAGASGGPLGPTKRALNEAALEAVIPGLGGPAKAAGQLAVKKIAKIKDAGSRVNAWARELNVPIGIEPISGRSTLQGFRRVIGRFPFLGTPIQESDKAVAAALRKSKDALVHEIAPIAQNVLEAGVDLGTRGVRRVKAMSRIFSRRYEALLDQAEATGARVPSDRTREVAKDLVDEFTESLPKKRIKAKGQVLDQFGEPIQVEKLTPINIPNDQKILKFARDELTKLEDTMRPRQYQRLARVLNGLIGEVKDNKELTRQALLLRRALEEDFGDIIGDDAVVSGIREANRAFGTFAKLLSRPTGKRIAQTGRGVFTADIVAGSSKDMDQLFKTVFNADSPAAMTDLRTLVGRVPFRRALRTHIDDAFDQAINLSGKPTAPRGFVGDDDPVFNLGVVRKSLGLTKERSPRRAALAKALEESNSGVKIADLEKWFAVAEAQFKLGEIRVSDFIARRAQLGGIRGVLRAVIPGATVTGLAGGGSGAAAGGLLGGVGGATGAIMMVLAARGAGRFLTDPKRLRLATDILDTSLTPTKRNAVAARFMRVFAQDILSGDLETEEPVVPEAITRGLESR